MLPRPPLEPLRASAAPAFAHRLWLWPTWALIVTAWGFLAWLVLDMDSELAQLTMPGTSAWSVANTVAIASMWAVMMAAMMLPSALPAITTFSTLSVRTGQGSRALGFVLGYLLTWVVFSGMATLGQWALQRAGWVDPMIVSRSAPLTATLLILAGAYQFSALKRRCLSACRHPMGLLLAHWRPGVRGAATMGWRYGTFCVGCCWALMVLLFVGGVMNLSWIAALTVAAAAEKLGPGGQRVAVVLGLGLLGAGAWHLVTLVAR